MPAGLVFFTDYTADVGHADGGLAGLVFTQGVSTADYDGDVMLLETGDNVLLETGDNALLEA